VIGRLLLALTLLAAQPAAAAGFRLDEIEGDWRMDVSVAECGKGMMVRFEPDELPPNADPVVRVILWTAAGDRTEDTFTASGQETIAPKLRAGGKAWVMRRLPDGRISLPTPQGHGPALVRCPRDAELKAAAAAAFKPSDADILVGSWAESPVKRRFYTSCQDAQGGEFRIFREGGKLRIARNGSVNEITVRAHTAGDKIIPISPALVVTEGTDVYYAARAGDQLVWWQEAWLPSREGRALVRCGD
jgi:hypothetical protein